MKYELTENTRDHFGATLYQIKALRDFGNVRAGDLGGWVASEDNLSQEGSCWVSGNAWVYDSAKVYGNARVSGNAKVYCDAKVFGNAEVSGNARVYGDAEVFGNAWVYDDARVSGNAWVYDSAMVFGNTEIKRGVYSHIPASITRSDGYTFTLQSDMSIVAGCRDFTPEEADNHWGSPSHHKHKESWAIVQALRTIHKTREE